MRPLTDALLLPAGLPTRHELATAPLRDSLEETTGATVTGNEPKVRSVPVENRFSMCEIRPLLRWQAWVSESGALLATLAVPKDVLRDCTQVRTSAPQSQVRPLRHGLCVGALKSYYHGILSLPVCDDSLTKTLWREGSLSSIRDA